LEIYKLKKLLSTSTVFDTKYSLYAEKCKIRAISEDMDHTLQGIGDL